MSILYISLNIVDNDIFVFSNTQSFIVRVYGTRDRHGVPSTTRSSLDRITTYDSKSMTLKIGDVYKSTEFLPCFRVWGFSFPGTFERMTHRTYIDHTWLLITDLPDEVIEL